MQAKMARGDETRSIIGADKCAFKISKMTGVTMAIRRSRPDSHKISRSLLFSPFISRSTMFVLSQWTILPSFLKMSAFLT